jgi:hypothetical protein
MAVRTGDQKLAPFDPQLPCHPAAYLFLSHALCKNSARQTDAPQRYVIPRALLVDRSTAKKVKSGDRW